MRRASRVVLGSLLAWVAAGCGGDDTTPATSDGTGGHATSSSSGGGSSSSSSSGSGAAASSASAGGAGGSGGIGGASNSSASTGGAGGMGGMGGMGAVGGIGGIGGTGATGGTGGAGGVGGGGPVTCVSEIAAGLIHTCARKMDGTVWCWGDDADGQLGDGIPSAPNPSPQQVTALGATVVEIATDYDHGCARKTDGTLWCWGRNAEGQLGNGTTGTPQPPVQVTALTPSMVAVVQLATGFAHTCARKADGTVWCWGNNSYGALGDGTTNTPMGIAVQVLAPAATTFVEVAAGLNFSCGRHSDKTLWCWGENDFGQIGDGTTGAPKPAPVQVASLGNDVVQVTAGEKHACARKGDGTLWCWGLGGSGQIGDGTTDTSKPTPVQVTALGTSVVDVAAGSIDTCARKSDGTLWCWGWNGSGEVGDGTTDTPKPSPVEVIALGADVIGVEGGGDHACARKADDTLHCWGFDGYGEIGDGSIAPMKPVTLVPLVCP